MRRERLGVLTAFVVSSFSIVSKMQWVVKIR